MNKIDSLMKIVKVVSQNTDLHVVIDNYCNCCMGECQSDNRINITIDYGDNLETGERKGRYE